MVKGASFFLKDEVDFLRFSLQTPSYPGRTFEITYTGDKYVLDENAARSVVAQYDAQNGVVRANSLYVEKSDLLSALYAIGMDTIVKTIKLFHLLDPVYDNSVVSNEVAFAKFLESRKIGAKDLHKLSYIQSLSSVHGLKYEDILLQVRACMDHGLLDELVALLINNIGQKVQFSETKTPRIRKVQTKDFKMAVESLIALHVMRENISESRDPGDIRKVLIIDLAINMLTSGDFIVGVGDIPETNRNKDFMILGNSVIFRSNYQYIPMENVIFDAMLTVVSASFFNKQAGQNQ